MKPASLLEVLRGKTCVVREQLVGCGRYAARCQTHAQMQPERLGRNELPG